MLKRVLASFFILIVLIVIGGQFLSPKFQAKAVGTLKAPKSKVHEVIGNLETWEDWGPWMKYDPNMKIERGPVTGVGATQKWQSADGNGRLVFTEVDSATGIKYDLFFDEFPKTTAEFSYEDVDGGTQVTWTMNGEIHVPLIGGYLSFFFRNMVSNSFVDGLENLNKYLQDK